MDLSTEEVSPSIFLSQWKTKFHYSSLIFEEKEDSSKILGEISNKFKHSPPPILFMLLSIWWRCVIDSFHVQINQSVNQSGSLSLSPFGFVCPTIFWTNTTQQSFITIPLSFSALLPFLMERMPSTQTAVSHGKHTCGFNGINLGILSLNSGYLYSEHAWYLFSYKNVSNEAGLREATATVGLHSYVSCFCYSEAVVHVVPFESKHKNKESDV